MAYCRSVGRIEHGEELSLPCIRLQKNECAYSKALRRSSGGLIEELPCQRN